MFALVSSRSGSLSARYSSEHYRAIMALLFLVISPEQISKPNSCALHNFLLVWNIFIFGSGMNKDQCHMQNRQLWLSLLHTYFSWSQKLVQPKLIFWRGFSSPEHNMLRVSYCDCSVSVVHHQSSVVHHASSTICFKWHLLHNYWADVNQSW